MFDPEIPTNVYDLGLICGRSTPWGQTIVIKMTPDRAGLSGRRYLPGLVERNAVETIDGVDHCQVDLPYGTRRGPKTG